VSTCRGCGDAGLCRVLGLGKGPAADHFPLRTEPVRPAESFHPLAMNLCTCCGRAQLVHDGTVTAEPCDIELQALRDQDVEALRTDVAIISPEQLSGAEPNRVLLALPELYKEVRQRYSQLNEGSLLDTGALL
jgi:hypothetical protein